MCRLEAAELSSSSVRLLLQLVKLKLVLLGFTTVLGAFQLVLEPAAGALHLGHLSGREAKTGK